MKTMRVICAIDDSPYSQEVVEVLTAREWPEDCEIKLLTVLEPVELEGNGEFLELRSEIQDKRKDAAKNMLEKARSKISGSETINVHFEIREGCPKEEILKAAVEWSADKILLGAHGHGICPRHILGSISRTVAAHAPCTVEIVRSSSRAKAKAH